MSDRALPVVRGEDLTWTPKVCKIMALTMAVILGLGLLFNILLGFRYVYYSVETEGKLIRKSILQDPYVSYCQMLGLPGTIKDGHRVPFGSLVSSQTGFLRGAHVHQCLRCP